MAEMGVKLNVFKDPFLDRASETKDLMDKIKDLNGGELPFGRSGGSTEGGTEGGIGGRKDYLNNLMSINDDLRAKGERMNDLRRKRDQLDARQMKRKGLAELRTGLQDACGEYDKMADDLEK